MTTQDPNKLLIELAKNALRDREYDIRKRLYRLEGKVIKKGTHDYLGGSVSLAGAEVDFVLDRKDEEPAVRLILTKKNAADGPRILTITLPELIRAGVKV